MNKSSNASASKKRNSRLIARAEFPRDLRRYLAQAAHHEGMAVYHLAQVDRAFMPVLGLADREGILTDEEAENLPVDYQRILTVVRKSAAVSLSAQIALMEAVTLIPHYTRRKKNGR